MKKILKIETTWEHLTPLTLSSIYTHFNPFQNDKF